MARTVKKEKALTPGEKLAQTLVPDVEQPYRVPENWCWVYIGAIAKVLNGFAFKSAHYTDTGIRIVRITNVQDGYIEDDSPVFYPENSFCEIEKYLLKENDLLISLTGNVGRVAILPSSFLPAAQNQRVGCLRTKDSTIILKYLYYSFLREDFQKDCIKNAKGSAQLNMSTEWLKEQVIPLAPLAEQQHIVDRIESLFAKLDEAKEKAQAVIDGYEDRRAAILHKAFTGELTEEWRQNNGVSRDTWNNYTIGDMFIHTTGKALKKSNTNGSLHKYITTSNLYWGRFDFSEVREMYFTDDELDKCTAQKGDLLICNGGDVGRAAIWNYDYDICIQNHISKLRKKQNNIDVVFCYYFFILSKIKGKINSKGIGIASLSAKDLLAMPIDVPSIEEQHEISSILDELFNNEQQAKEAAEQVIDQIDSMKKSILARAFRGELGTNDPNDEPAIELLKRINNKGE